MAMTRAGLCLGLLWLGCGGTPAGIGAGGAGAAGAVAGGGGAGLAGTGGLTGSGGGGGAGDAGAGNSGSGNAAGNGGNAGNSGNSGNAGAGNAGAGGAGSGGAGGAAGAPGPVVAGGVFEERFVFRGAHEATRDDADATTVHWDADAWSVRADTSHNNLYVLGSRGHWIGVHPGFAAPGDGGKDLRSVPGGDGGPGVGIMHLDFETIASARLRNPMAISAERPGIVEFRTTRVVTTGHWWELAVTPAADVTGGEFTAVPVAGTDRSVQFAGHPGSGHAPASPSVNVVTTGRDDIPCSTGWSFVMGASWQVDGLRGEHVGPTIDYDVSEPDRLVRFRFTYYPDHIVAEADLDDDGTLEPLGTFPVRIPWSLVHVQLLGVAYQADHHPQGECFLGQVRDIPWKDVRVEPVQLVRTAAYPKGREDGWMRHDVRDLRHFSPTPVGGQPQPNVEAMDKWSSVLYCGLGTFYCQPVATKTLRVTLPPGEVRGLGASSLLYDIRTSDPASPGRAVLLVNGTRVGELVGWQSVPGANQRSHWAPRALAIPTALLVAGENEVRLDLEGAVELDRLQLELGYTE